MSADRATLLLATTNAGKLRELGALLAPLDLDLVSASDFDGRFEVEEGGRTFAENAEQKARAWADHATLPALAEDSGLEVDALDGRPGVMSARWVPGSDEDRMLALLDRLSGVDDPRARSARYRAVAAIALPGIAEISTASGVVEGRIAHRPRGRAGFGYDPIFLVIDGPHAGERTMAELTPAEKNALSHRARAIDGLIPCLLELAGGRSG